VLLTAAAINELSICEGDVALFETPIALEPAAGGGHSIGDSALEAADIIVSTTHAGTSRVIRIGTVSVVSHAALYIGSGYVIEAIGEGVKRRDLRQSLADDVLAVAYRSPAMNQAIANRIVKYATAQQGIPYSVPGAAMSADKVLCRIVGPQPASFFCSQLVFEAYRRAGLPLADTPSQCVTPKDVAVIARRRLVYVGHLLGHAGWFPIFEP
jgi:cell wall-associated NlpC family hydrolase